MITTEKIIEVSDIDGGTLMAYTGNLFVTHHRYFLFDDTGLVKLLDPLDRLKITDGVYRIFIIVESDFDQVITTDYDADYEPIVYDMNDVNVVNVDKGVSKLRVRIAVNEEEPSSGGILDETGTLPYRYIKSLKEYDNSLVEIFGGMIRTETESWYQILSIKKLQSNVKT